VLYVGVTSDLSRRISEHRVGRFGGFTSQYRVDKLVYFEEFSEVRMAIAREKMIKSWRRAKKESLIGAVNPDWKDLAADAFF
jgi:putative endonuclease